MFVHFINERPVAIAEQNLFSNQNSRYLEFQKLMQEKGLEWEDNHRMLATKNSYDFTTTQTKLFTSHENFDTKFYDFIIWLSGSDIKREVFNNFI